MPEVKMKLKPFTVPNYAIMEMPPRPRQEGMKEAPTFHLNESEKSTPVVSIETKTHGLSR